MILAQLIGQTLDDKYRIEKQLGQGGMGAVYLATHVGTKRPVAVKVITPQFMAHTEFVERFKREAEAAGRLRHPNVVNVTDFGFAQIDQVRIAYLVMEYLDGCNLGEVLNEESRLPLNFVVDIIEQVCTAVDEAHQQGIIHRDLKPDNIWLEPNRRGSYTVKVLDFGLAKIGETTLPTDTSAISNNNPSLPPTAPSLVTALQVSTGSAGSVPAAIVSHKAVEEFMEAATQAQLPAMASPAASALTVALPSDDDEGATQVQPQQTGSDDNLQRKTEALTRIGAILGTPIYMSPEQCAGNAIDTRSDIYSIGVIAYEMLAGQPPFTGNAASLMQQHRSAPPPPLRDRRAKVPKKIANLIMSTLEKDPAKRPASAAVFASTLRARSEGAGSLVRQAIALYSEHFMTFIRISLISYLPFIFTLIGLGILGSQGTTSVHVKTITPLAIILIFLTLFLGICFLFANILNCFISVPVLLQLRRFPLRKVELRPIYKILKARWWAAVITSLRLYSRIMWWGLFGLFPVIIPWFRYQLVYAVFMMEGLEQKAALNRSRELVKRARLTVLLITVVQLTIVPFARMIGDSLMGSIIINSTLKPNFPLALFQSFINILGIIPSIFLTPLVAILLVLLYFNTRLAGGEIIMEELQLENEIPAAKWQQRMEERLRLRTAAYSGGSNAKNSNNVSH